MGTNAQDLARDEDPSAFAELDQRLSLIERTCGYATATLATDLQTTKTTIRNWKRSGRMQPRFIVALQQLTGVDPQWLKTGVGIPFPHGYKPSRRNGAPPFDPHTPCDLGSRYAQYVREIIGIFREKENPYDAIELAFDLIRHVSSGIQPNRRDESQLRGLLEHWTRRMAAGLAEGISRDEVAAEILIKLELLDQVERGEAAAIELEKAPCRLPKLPITAAS